MKPGQIIEAAVWLNGEETPEEMARWKTVDLPDMFKIAEFENGIMLGEIWYEEKELTDERVPEVPDHIHGDNVKLLVGCAKVLRFTKPTPKEKSFLDDLKFEDLQLLRRITVAAHLEKYPDYKGELSDKRCDAIIEELGPEIAERVLWEAVNKLH